MNKTFKVYLKAGERLFVNGAVLRVDRKASIEFLNDVAFLLEAHVMQAEEATTPLRQLYFIVQAMLIDNGRASEAREMYERLHINFMKTFDSAVIREGLTAVHELIQKAKLYEALKTIRGLFAAEETPDRISPEASLKERVESCRL